MPVMVFRRDYCGLMMSVDQEMKKLDQRGKAEEEEAVANISTPCDEGKTAANRVHPFSSHGRPEGKGAWDSLQQAPQKEQEHQSLCCNWAEEGEAFSFSYICYQDS